MRRVSVLAGVCGLMVLSSGAARAQAPSSQAGPLVIAGAGVTRTPGELSLAPRYSVTPSYRASEFSNGTTSASPRSDQALVGSGRLGISPPQAPNASEAPDPLAAMRAASLRHRGPGVALMLVGAAGVITGLLIDESLITVAGAGVGLVGLYLYLR